MNSSLLGKTVLELLELLAKKKISANEIRDYFLRRIEKYNKKINAFVTVVEEDKTNKTDKNDRMERTIPLAIKDNFCTKGIRTTASSKVLENFIPPYESTVTLRLLKNGYYPIGKTNMDAWAHGSSTETSDFGPTKNPWDLTRSPGGSSGGSAAAVSAYLSPAAIGSETAGSIRQPAAWTGVVGLKPSYGRVSRYGLIAMGSSLDCPGPMTLSVEDAALLLWTVAGEDPYDATTVSEELPEYLLKKIKEKRKYTIGVPEEYFEGVTDEIKSQVNRAIEIFKKMGHSVKKVKLLLPKYAISVYTIIQRAEVSSNLARYDGIRYGNNRDFFGPEAKRRIMLGTFTLSQGYYDAFYKKAEAVRQLIKNDFEKAFQEVDLIVGPTTPVTALKIGEWEKYPFFGEMMDVLNEPAAVSGLPAINIPVGLSQEGLPVGMQIIGRYLDEIGILNLAYQFEKETNFFGVIKKGLENYPD